MVSDFFQTLCVSRSTRGPIQLVLAAVAVCVVLSGCLHRTSRPLTWSHTRTLDAVIVPGCPTRIDGTPSGCQWERAFWAASLWQDHVTDHIVVSGGAVHTPYVEAETLRAILLALDVPDEVIFVEREARHSDENGLFGMAIAEEQGWTDIGIASHTGHANTIKWVLASNDHRVVAMELDWVGVRSRMARGLPEVEQLPGPVTTGIPNSGPAIGPDWRPLGERDAAQTRQGLPSWLRYPVVILGRWFPAQRRAADASE